jgi:hypothetical protein
MLISIKEPKTFPGKALCQTEGFFMGAVTLKK